MIKQNYNVIGVMSGTSLDGVDLAHIHFSLINNRWSFELFECETIPYSNEWLEKLKSAIDFSKEELVNLNRQYTLLLGNIINGFIEKYKIKNIDAVCSHGHTILHQPQNGFTLQIGNLPQIAEITNQSVVCDFRVQDVSLGGQGAPLVPIGDRFLFADFDYCLNLGGFSNISFEQNSKRIAFDISPVNTVLNFYSNKLGYDYDNKGLLAKSGNINEELFIQLNELEYYKKDFPKSLGLEYVKNTILPIIENFKLTNKDILRTFTEHIAFQIAKVLTNKNGKLLITGGGAYNEFLIERIRHFSPNINIVIPNHKILEYKEALIFGFLGILRLRNEINVLSSVTGSKHDHCSGIIYNKNHD